MSPEKVVFDGEVTSVTVPGTAGSFEILQNHAPIISSLESGKVVYQPARADKTEVDIRSGFVEVRHDEVSLCVEM